MTSNSSLKFLKAVFVSTVRDRYFFLKLLLCKMKYELRE